MLRIAPVGLEHDAYVANGMTVITRVINVVESQRVFDDLLGENGHELIVAVGQLLDNAKEKLATVEAVC